MVADDGARGEERGRERGGEGEEGAGGGGGEGGKKGGRSELVSTKDLSCKKREPREGPINN